MRTLAEDLDPAETARRERSLGMLLALNRTGKHVYAGTVAGAEKARRRAQGKRARIARRAHR